MGPAGAPSAARARTGGGGGDLGASSLGPQRMFAASGRTVSGGSAASGQGQRKSDRWVLSSPLAGPVITNDADEGLFDFDT